MDSEGRKSNLPKLLLAVGAFAVAGVIWYLKHEPGAQADFSRTERNLVCTSCGAEFSAKIKLGSEGEAQFCPKCKAAAGWPLKYCSACKYKFPPPLVGDPPRPAPMPNCPKCGSNKAVGAYIPEFFEAMNEPGQ